MMRCRWKGRACTVGVTYVWLTAVFVAQVVIRTADELKAFNKEEERLMEESIKSIADSGAKVVVAGGSIRWV